MSELKPCPFCGGEAETCHVTQLWEPRDSYWAKCKNCRISGTHHTTEAQAIAAWNSRAERTCKPIIEPWDDPTKYDAYCGNCNYSLGDGELEPWNYCPNCGKAVKR